MAYLLKKKGQDFMDIQYDGINPSVPPTNLGPVQTKRGRPPWWTTCSADWTSTWIKTQSGIIKKKSQ